MNVFYIALELDVTLHTIRLILRMAIFYKIMEKEKYKLMLKYMTQF